MRTSVNVSARTLPETRSVRDLDLFRQKHPELAADLLYMLDISEECGGLMREKAAKLDFEAVYQHIFGGIGAPCERCRPAFFREKQVLESRLLALVD